MSSLFGWFFVNRYTVPLKFASSLAGHPIEELNWVNAVEVQHFVMNQYDSIKDERARNLLQQLSNECNQNDTVSCYLQLGVNNLQIWTHKTEQGNKIFLVSNGKYKSRSRR